MPGASEATQRVKILNANWVPDPDGGDRRFELMAAAFLAGLVGPPNEGAKVASIREVERLPPEAATTATPNQEDHND